MSRAAAQSMSGGVVGTVVKRSGRCRVGAGSRRQVSPSDTGSSQEDGAATLPMSTCPQSVSLPASMSHWYGSPRRHSAIALRAAALSAQPMIKPPPWGGPSYSSHSYRQRASPNRGGSFFCMAKKDGALVYE